ncbi:hypothetical protein [Kineococcus sp. SYSU DK005]|uniref:hypothetical protein n=1 Tax=Kineococcus sp. SYSU DK005 TaxID=3383126 RepID=UPI003D7DC593
MTQQNPASRRPGLACAVAALSAALVLAPAASAAADTSTATATAVDVKALGTAAVSTGVSSADNTGEPPATVVSPAPLTALPGQNLVTGGVMAQHARAGSDGTSAACAGVLSSGGSLSVGSTGECTRSGTATGGVVLTLVPALGLVPATQVRADAIVSSCTARSDGTAVPKVQLVGAGVYVGTVKTFDLTALLAAGTTSVTVPGVATLGLAATSTSGGKATATALTVKLLSGALDAQIATVSCGQNVRVMPTPALPLQGLPLAAGFLAVAGVVAHRRGLLTREALKAVVRR